MSPIVNDGLSLSDDYFEGLDEKLKGHTLPQAGPPEAPRPEKRLGGHLNAKGNWLVLDGESTRAADGSWKHRCGADIVAQTVYHSVHDGLFLLSGSGEVRTERVPYCPTCETAPNWQGAPIKPGRQP